MKKREQYHQPQYNRILNSLPTTISTISFYRLYIYRTGITNINKRKTHTIFDTETKSKATKSGKKKKNDYEFDVSWQTNKNSIITYATHPKWLGTFETTKNDSSKKLHEKKRGKNIIKEYSIVRIQKR